MAERPQEHDFVRASINQERGGIPGIHLPMDRPLLGSGGQGWVFYAEETDGTPRALKVHRAMEGMTADEAARSALSFENEGAWLQQFDHPNIIKVFRTGIHERTIRGEGEHSSLKHTKDYRYMLMEYAELGSVADRIANNQKLRNIGMLPVGEAVLCIVHATEGMRYAHGELGNLPDEVPGVTHGDLNPRNLVIAAADRREAATDERKRVVKVADFGIARRGHSSVETMTSTQLHAFSLPYASPNQIETGNVFYADDVYSLGGVTAYELLSGMRPFDPENKTVFGYFNAHNNAIVPPMERLTADGKPDPIVDALNEVVLPAFNRDPSGRVYATSHTHGTMGEYQAAFNEALARGAAEAERARTIIIFPKKKDTLPLLLDAELPPEGETMNLTRSDETLQSSAATEVAGVFPGDTRLSEPEDNASMSRRRFFEVGGIVAIVGVVGGGALWLNNQRQNDAERQNKEREKHNQERAAIVGLGYKVADLLAQLDAHDSIVPAVLEHIIPNDPQGVVPRIEQLQASDNYYNAALLGARLAHYNQTAAQKIMQTYLDKGKYGEGAIIAAQLASFAQTPAGSGSGWKAEAERVRSVIASSTNSMEAGRKYYTEMITAALNPKDASSTQTLKTFIDKDPTPGLEALSLAMARHNPDAIRAEAIRFADKTRALPANTDNGTIEWHYRSLEKMCRALAPHSTEGVKEVIEHISNKGRTFSDRAETAVQRLVVELVPYDAEQARKYIKNGSEAPSGWDSSRWGSTAVIALGSVDPVMVAVHDSAAITSPFAEFLDATLDPLNPDHIDKALTVIKNPNYLKDYGPDLIAALLVSRQIKD